MNLDAIDLAEFSELVKILEEKTPLDIPARAEVIANATRAWLMERMRVKRIAKSR